jgi:glutaredoxin 3
MKPVRIYTTSICPYCDSAKRLFKSLGVPFEEISLDGRHEERQRLSEANAGWRTVPMIFVGDKFMGGFTDVKAVHDRGELLPLIHGSEP